MKCPKCNEEIETVLVFSRCSQTGYLNAEGKIDDYSEVDEIYETESIECPECGNVIEVDE